LLFLFVVAILLFLEFHRKLLMLFSYFKSSFFIF
jgi:ADP-ribosylation factor-like protein 1